MYNNYKNKTKVKFNADTESIALQKYLFSIGYKWGGGGDSNKQIKYTDKPFITIYHELKEIYFSENALFNSDYIISYRDFMNYLIISNI